MYCLIKAFILGAEGAGKTELNKHLTFPGYVNTAEKKYFRSIAPDFNIVTIPNANGTDKTTLQIWDAPGNQQYKTIFKNKFYAKSHFGLFCIDLSKPLDQNVISELKSDLAEFKAINPGAHLILIGTKNDITLPNALQTAQQEFAEYPFTAAVATSAREADGSQELLNHLVVLIPRIIGELQQEQLKLTEEIKQYEEERRTILHARNRCSINSNLYFALDKLHHETACLSVSQVKKLGHETNTLLDHLENSNIHDKTPCIKAFITHCTEEVQGKDYLLKSTLLTIAYSLTLAVMASLIGFGVGFALGAWSGPGAFFTGLAMGSASAITVVSSASLCGTGTFAYSSYQFFKSTPILSALKETAEKGNKTDLIHFNESHIFNEASHGVTFK